MIRVSPLSHVLLSGDNIDKIETPASSLFRMRSVADLAYHSFILCDVGNVCMDILVMQCEPSYVSVKDFH